MKIILWVIGILLLVVLVLGGLQYLASERVEVVELHTMNRDGAEVVTRLWIVDYQGMQYLRTGAEASSWFSRLQANKEVSLTRRGATQCYTTRLRRDKHVQINLLMQTKYTWGDSLIDAIFGGREGSIPIELHPCSPPRASATQ